jgi:hypothetical protein
MKNIITKIKEWYRGEFIPAPYDPDSRIARTGHIERPFLAKILGQIGKFWLNHWKWILTFIVAVAGLIVAIIKLSNG